MDTDTKIYENLSVVMDMDTNILENRVWTRTWSRRVTGVHRTLYKQSTLIPGRSTVVCHTSACPVISTDKFAEFPIINWRASYFLLRDHCIMKCMRTSFLNSISEMKWPSTHRGQIGGTRSVHFSRIKCMILTSIDVKAIIYRHVLKKCNDKGNLVSALPWKSYSKLPIEHSTSSIIEIQMKNSHGKFCQSS